MTITTFNRTIVELKSGLEWDTLLDAYSFNRTIVELK